MPDGNVINIIVNRFRLSALTKVYTDKLGSPERETRKVSKKSKVSKRVFASPSDSDCGCCTCCGWMDSDCLLNWKMLLWHKISLTSRPKDYILQIGQLNLQITNRFRDKSLP